MIDIEVSEDDVDINLTYETALSLLAMLTDTIESYPQRPDPDHRRIRVRFTAPATGGIDITLGYSV